jgi:hypothetical protein
MASNAAAEEEEVEMDKKLRKKERVRERTTLARLACIFHHCGYKKSPLHHFGFSACMVGRRSKARDHVQIDSMHPHEVLFLSNFPDRGAGQFEIAPRVLSTAHHQEIVESVIPRTSS